MQFVVSADYSEMSETAAEDFLFCLEKSVKPIVCLPSGKTPVGFCQKIREHFLKLNARPDWIFVGLDEWAGVGPEKEGGCRHFFDIHLFKPLGIPDEQICFFNGQAADSGEESDRIAGFIRAHGPIDLIVLGIGTNGHLGFNEPGSDPSFVTQYRALEPSTMEAAKGYFPEGDIPTHGYTLGLSTILQARTIFLLANGHHKALVIRQATKGPVSAELPASYLQQHPNCFFYLDEAAATELDD